MCGIAGVLYADPHTPVDPAVLKAMGNAIAHRGPDAEKGFFQGPGYRPGTSPTCGHRSIPGDQPMGNEDGAVQVVFNGEIYNFQHIRDRIYWRGHIFRSGPTPKS